MGLPTLFKIFLLSEQALYATIKGHQGLLQVTVYDL